MAKAFDFFSAFMPSLAASPKASEKQDKPIYDYTLPPFFQKYQEKYPSLQSEFSKVQEDFASLTQLTAVYPDGSSQAFNLMDLTDSQDNDLDANESQDDLMDDLARSLIKKTKTKHHLLFKNRYLLFFMKDYFNSIMKSKNIQFLFHEVCRKSMSICFMRRKLYLDIKQQMTKMSKRWSEKRKIELHQRLVFLKFMI